MIEINPEEQSPRDMYKLIIGAIVPRPIAFVSTKGKDGSCNLAPYSFFNGVSSNPPCLMLSCGAAREKEKKDTLTNIEETGEFVVNSANEWTLEQLVSTAADYPYGVDEMEQVGLTSVPSVKVQAPRVKEAAVHFECKLHKLVPIGDGSPGSSTMVIGEIVYAHVKEECYENGRILFDQYRAVGRLGGFGYGKIGETLEIPVPDLKSSN